MMKKGLLCLFLLAIKVVKSSTDQFKRVKPSPAKGCPLTAFILDKWGDSWNGASLSISLLNQLSAPGMDLSDDDSAVLSYEPSLGQGVLKVSILLPPSSVAKFSVSNSPIPIEFWEIWWSLSLKKSRFIGTFNSSLVVSCVWDSPVQYELVVSNESNVVEPKCSQCRVPKPKPKPAPDSLDSSKPKPPPPTIFQYPLLLASTDGDGWTEPEGYSGKDTSYYISNADRSALITSGSMCDESFENFCEESLEDGDYIFRVSGNGNKNKHHDMWQFCGVLGKPQQELPFTVQKGKCVPGTLVDAPKMKVKVKSPQKSQNVEAISSVSLSSDQSEGYKEFGFSSSSDETTSKLMSYGSTQSTSSSSEDYAFLSYLSTDKVFILCGLIGSLAVFLVGAQLVTGVSRVIPAHLSDVDFSSDTTRLENGSSTGGSSRAFLNKADDELDYSNLFSSKSFESNKSGKRDSKVFKSVDDNHDPIKIVSVAISRTRREIAALHEGVELPINPVPEAVCLEQTRFPPKYPAKVAFSREEQMLVGL